MTHVTLKALYTYLKVLENPSELKRRMPASGSQRTLKEGLLEMTKLVGIDSAFFKDPQNISAVIGAPRFVMIWGEPSVSAYLARIFDSSKILWSVLVGPEHPENVASAAPVSSFNVSPPHPMAKPVPPSWAESPNPTAGSVQESVLVNLIPLLAGNTALTCQLFRVLFEHMLGFASQSSNHQESAVMVNELTGTKEHGRSFLATAMYILGSEIDRENLISFLLEQRLFGMPIFEQLIQHRDYCAAHYSFRRLERAFVAPRIEEEKQLRIRMDRFNSQFGGAPYDGKLFEGDDLGKGRVDAHLGAIDLLEAMALTPLSMVFNNAVGAAATNGVRSMKTIARHFERFAVGESTKEQVNQEIADHLLAFARQFCADSK